MHRLAVTWLRVCLGLMFLGMLAVQILLPSMSVETARANPEFAHAQYPVLIASLLGVACVQVVVVCVWNLLTRVEDGAIFTPHSFAWVNRMIWAFVAASFLAFALFVYLASTNVGNPGTMLIHLATFGGGVTVTLLLVVMRGLLIQAAGLQRDTEGLI